MPFNKRRTVRASFATAECQGDDCARVEWWPRSDRSLSQLPVLARDCHLRMMLVAATRPACPSSSQRGRLLD